MWRSGANRWRVHARGRPRVVVSCRLVCAQRSVTTNWVGEAFGVLNGAATFVTLAEQARRPHEVRLELPSRWTRSMTTLDSAPDGAPNHYRAPDYDTLVDSPIVAGALSVHEFEVDGRRHALVDAEERGHWDGQRAARDLQKIVEETRRFWGGLPYPRYLFLNVLRHGGGGLEHANSTLLTMNPPRPATRQSHVCWLAFVSHEFLHAFYGKRLRPVELGPFDYERPPRTSSLWIAEGFTTYYGQLIVRRAGLAAVREFLPMLSAQIRQVQISPGRLVQTLEQSSLDVWTAGGVSGVGVDPKTAVRYYAKGVVVGFRLDARVRRATGDRRSLDDVMRPAYPVAPYHYLCNGELDRLGSRPGTARGTLVRQVRRSILPVRRARHGPICGVHAALRRATTRSFGRGRAPRAGPVAVTGFPHSAVLFWPFATAPRSRTDDPCGIPGPRVWIRGVGTQVLFVVWISLWYSRLVYIAETRGRIASP